MFKNLREFVNFAETDELPEGMSPEEFFSHASILEKEVNHRLLNITGNNKLVLTNFGRHFLQYAKKGLKTLEDGIRIASELNIYDYDNLLTLGISRDSASSWAINCIKNFNKMHPGLRLSIIANDCMDKEMAEKSTIIFWCVDEQDLPDFDRLWYIEYRYGLYASRSYIEKFGEPTLDNLKDHNIIAYSGSDNNTGLTNWHLSPKYGLPDIVPNVFAQSRDLIARMTAEGIGIGAICDNQDAYYGYKPTVRVLTSIDGPILKSYFCVRSGLNEQMFCNIDLLSRLFRKYFEDKGIEVFYAH